MNISIIGSNGFLAGSIGKYCNNMNYEVHSWGFSEEKNYQYSTFHNVDLLNNEIDVEKLSQSQIIIYAAGAGIQSNLNENFKAIYMMNTFVPIRIIKALNELDFKGYIVTFGSYFELGENQRDSFFTEEEIITSVNPVPNDYCVSKRLLTRFISSTKTNSKNYHFILPTIYGENENPKRLVPYIMSAVKNHQDLEFTAGSQTRQYLYVDDVPPVIFNAIAENIDSGVYNIAGDDNFEIRELVAVVLNHLNYPESNAHFGQTDKPDTGMKILKLDDKLLKSKIGLNSKTKFIEVISKYLET